MLVLGTAGRGGPEAVAAAAAAAGALLRLLVLVGGGPVATRDCAGADWAVSLAAAAAAARSAARVIMRQTVFMKMSLAYAFKRRSKSGDGQASVVVKVDAPAWVNAVLETAARGAALPSLKSLMYLKYRCNEWKGQVELCTEVRSQSKSTQLKSLKPLL